MTSSMSTAPIIDNDRAKYIGNTTSLNDDQKYKLLTKPSSNGIYVREKLKLVEEVSWSCLFAIIARWRVQVLYIL